MSRKDTALKYFTDNGDFMDTVVKQNIERYRKGKLVLNIKDENGNAVKGARITAVQRKHEFRYGANIFMLDEFEKEEKNKKYREAFADLFNLATVPFYWSDLEPVQGKPRYTPDSPRVYRRPATDLCVSYCLDKGIEPKCHCLNYDNFTPDWVKCEDVDTHKKYLEKRFRELAARYADVIPSWEVTNETLQGTVPSNMVAGRTRFYYQEDFLDWSFRMADRYFPANRLIINDYEVWDGAFRNDRSAYYMQIERLMSGGISHLDSIGMQYHSFFPQEREEAMAKTRYNPIHIYDVLDRYAKLGKAIQITEMTLPAYSMETGDEEVQAELLKNVYTTFFSHPAMEAVIYWNLVDGYAAFAPMGDMKAGENKFCGGLMRFDMSEKPAYRMLKELFTKEWHTEARLETGEGGEASLCGFYGDYDLEIAVGEKTVKKSVRLLKKGPSAVTLSL